MLTVEYDSGRLLRVSPRGSVTVVASGLRKPYSLARTRTGVVYVAESVEDYRQAGAIRRITPDRRVSAVPLRLVGTRTTAGVPGPARPLYP